MIKFNRQSQISRFADVRVGEFFVYEDEYRKPKLYIKLNNTTHYNYPEELEEDQFNAINVNSKEFEIFGADDTVIIAHCNIEVEY